MQTDRFMSNATPLLGAGASRAAGTKRRRLARRLNGWFGR
jgi:hypothetical protein